MRAGRWLASALTPVAAAVLGMAVAAPGSALAAHGKAAGGRPWLRPGLPVDQRVSLLLGRMTLDQKIAELHADACSPYESCVPANPALGLPELVLEDDSTGVAAGMTGVTALPATIAASASWDPALAARYGAVIGREERKKGVDVALAPTVNIMRNPQWGRNFESLGEDPYLTSRMGVADMSGIQSQGVVADMKHFAVYNQETSRKTISAQISSRALHEIYLPAWAAAVKAGLGSIMASYNAINGVRNSQNPYLLTQVLRDELGFTGFVRSDGGGTYSTVPAAEAGLDMQVKGTDYFAAPLTAAVEDGQVSMATINSMVAPILRVMFEFHLAGKTWGQGTATENVITPQDTRTALDTAEQGTVLLKNRGGLLPLSGPASVAVIGPDASPGMPEGSGSGYVNPPFVTSPVQGIQAAARRASVTYTRGLPDPASLPSIPGQYLSAAYRAGRSYTATLTPPASGRYTLVAENTAGYQPMTLSLNGSPVLTAAGTTGDQYGSGSADLVAGQHYQLQISGPSVKLAWATPSARSAAIAQAVAAARQAQVAVVLVGDHESEAVDRVRVGLSSGQNRLVEAVAAANPHTIVVLNTGSPVVVPWAHQVPAMLESWYPGEEDGTALADVLFGKVDPAGHLPDTFPASASQIPASTPAQFPGVDGVAQYSEGIDVGYRWYETHHVTPLFPFGYGLSYTTFAFSDLHVSPGPATSLGTIKVAATVTNTGTRAGSEVAQLYVGDPASTGEPPRQLRGFQTVRLAPGRSARVHFTLTGQDLSWYDGTNGTWVVSPGTYRLYVGDSSALAGLPLRGTAQVRGSTGSRHVTVSAPGQAEAGRPVTVTATLTSGGNLTLHGSRLALSAPAGWRVRPAGRTTAGRLSPGQQMTASWEVTAPATAQDTIGRLTATAAYRAAGRGGSGTSTARTQVTVTGPLRPPAPARGRAASPAAVAPPGHVPVSVPVSRNAACSGARRAQVPGVLRCPACSGARRAQVPGSLTSPASRRSVSRRSRAAACALWICRRAAVRAAVLSPRFSASRIRSCSARDFASRPGTSSVVSMLVASISWSTPRVCWRNLLSAASTMRIWKAASSRWSCAKSGGSRLLAPFSSSRAAEAAAIRPSRRAVAAQPAAGTSRTSRIAKSSPRVTSCWASAARRSRCDCGAATNTPWPCRTCSRPCASRVFTASRTDGLLTPSSAARSRSDGSRSPGLISSVAMRFRICCAIRSETVPTGATDCHTCPPRAAKPAMPAPRAPSAWDVQVHARTVDWTPYYAPVPSWTVPGLDHTRVPINNEHIRTVDRGLSSGQLARWSRR